jgi:hypothetical protein
MNVHHLFGVLSGIRYTDKFTIPDTCPVLSNHLATAGTLNGREDR